MITKLIKKYGWLGVFCAALGATTAVHAEGTPAAEKAITAPTAYPGKVVVVDKNANTFTVEIQGQLYLFKATAQTRLIRKGKVVEFKDLSPGQEVTLVIQQAASGEIQVVSVTVESSNTEVEAAGGKPANSGQPVKKPVPGTGNGHNPNPPSLPPVVSPFN